MLPNSVLTLFLLLSLLSSSAGHASGDHSQNPSARIPSKARRFFNTTAHLPRIGCTRPWTTSSALKHSSPDLTLISQRNDGKFPYQRVKEIIEGKQPAPLAHGDQEMPIWGPIFHQVEADQDWGEVRLDAVTRHLASIQQK